MPELPEVETVARDLQRWVAGATIADVEVRWERTIAHPQPVERFVAELRGARISRVGRRAKSVLIHLADGRVMTVALRMTGALIVAAPGTPADAHARVVFRLADGRELRYRDVRKFGRIGLWQGGGLAAPRLHPAARRRAGSVVSGRGRLRSPWAGAADQHVHDRPACRAAARPERAAEEPPPRPVVHRGGRQHLCRRGAVARAAQPAARGGHADAGRGAAPASGHSKRPPAGDREPGCELLATTSARTASRARMPSSWPSTSAPASPACAAAAEVQRIVVGQRSTHFCPRCQPAPETIGAVAS